MKLALVDSLDPQETALQWSWMTRSSRRSARATIFRNSFILRLTCSRSTRRKSRAWWYPPRSWRPSPMMRGFVRNNKVHADCTGSLEVDYACGGKRRQRHGDASKAVQGQNDLPEASAARSQGGEACQDSLRPRSRQHFVVRKRTTAARTLTSCLKMQGPTQADVVPRLRSSCGNVRGSSDGSCA